jgi:hypothetical protein
MLVGLTHLVAAVWSVNKQGNTNDMNTFNDEMSSLLGNAVYPAVGEFDSSEI